MWIVWVPLVTGWLTLPYLALLRRNAWLHTPAFALTDPTYAGLRWVAAGVALVCLLLTAWCWARMDSNWSMAVSEAQRGELIVDGLFARVRHPIYALSVMLMLCSAVIVATMPMLVIAVIHVVLMHLKARNEERHLLKMHGVRTPPIWRTGRFVPRVGARPA
jgi:protein-S-isoprenylcysteine O-methyltransferase Ste14